MLNSIGHLWTEEVAFDATYHPPTMQCWDPSPDSLTNIHTCAHLASASSWVNDPQRLCKDTPTQSLKACNSPPVSLNWRSLLGGRWKVFKKIKQVQFKPLGWQLELVSMFCHWKSKLLGITHNKKMSGSSYIDKVISQKSRSAMKSALAPIFKHINARFNALFNTSGRMASIMAQCPSQGSGCCAVHLDRRWGECILLFPGWRLSEAGAS